MSCSDRWQWLTTEQIRRPAYGWNGCWAHENSQSREEQTRFSTTSSESVCWVWRRTRESHVRTRPAQDPHHWRRDRRPYRSGASAARGRDRPRDHRTVGETLLSAALDAGRRRLHKQRINYAQRGGLHRERRDMDQRLG